jgi:uncharacterized protein with PQ loop repeat
MSRAEFANLVGLVATAVTFVQILPQIVRLIRSGRIEGVSPAWATGGATINLGWLAYVIEGRFWVTIPSIIVAIVSFGLALYLLYRNGADIRAALLMSGAIAVASVVIQRAAGWTVLGTVLGLSNGLYLGPSVVAAWRSHVPVGVSPWTWGLTVLEGLKWGFYGVLVEAVPIMVYGSTAILLALLVLLRLWVARDRIRAALASPA